jgi:hypothetical protein
LFQIPISAIDEDMLDAMSVGTPAEKPDNLTGPRCRARFDFEGDGHDDLAFEDGDVIRLLARLGSDWLKGELDGRVGIFPAAYVEIIEDLAIEEEGGREATALFDFSGEAGELSFQVIMTL